MKEPSKPGPRKQLPDQKSFNTTLPGKHRKVIERYAALHGISLAASLRIAIELLEKEMQNA